MIRVRHLDMERIAREMASDPPPELADAMMGFRKDGSQQRAVAALAARGLYKLVASAMTDDLDEAWGLTNNDASAFGDWASNPRAGALGESTRSSMVGDLLEDGFGRFFVVASVGFEPMPADFDPDKRRSRPAAPR